MRLPRRYCCSWVKRDTSSHTSTRRRGYSIQLRNLNPLNRTADTDMKTPKWFIHPIWIFILSIAALGTSLFLYIDWYMEASVGLRSLVDKFNLDRTQVLESETWMVIMILSVLVGVILLGIFSIFVYSQKTLQLYRLQNNFINNFTHELKTPVTSLRLYLETFTKHHLPRSDQVRYIQFMIADVSRLTENINRILNVAKIESKSYMSEFIDADLAETISSCFKTVALSCMHLPNRCQPTASIRRCSRCC